MARETFQVDRDAADTPQEIGTASVAFASTPCGAIYVVGVDRATSDRTAIFWITLQAGLEINQPLSDEVRRGEVAWKRALAVSTIPTPTIAGHETAEQPLTVVVGLTTDITLEKKTGHEPIPSSSPRPRDHSAGTKVLRYTVTPANTMILAPSNSESRLVSATAVSSEIDSPAL